MISLLIHCAKAWIDFVTVYRIWVIIVTTYLMIISFNMAMSCSKRFNAHSVLLDHLLWWSISLFTTLKAINDQDVEIWARKERIWNKLLSINLNGNMILYEPHLDLERMILLLLLVKSGSPSEQLLLYYPDKWYLRIERSWTNKCFSFSIYKFKESLISVKGEDPCVKN